MRLAAVMLSIAAVQSFAICGAEFDLPASPSTVAWGYYSAHVKPALSVHSGDTVRVHTLSTCSIERMEAGGVPPNTIPQYDRDIHEQVKEKGPGGHVLTGPIEITESRAGRCARGADSKDRYRCAVCLQQFWSGSRFSTE